MALRMWISAIYCSLVFGLSLGSQTHHDFCLSTCVDEVLSTQTIKYEDCMRDCFERDKGEWLLHSENENRCGVSVPQDPESETPCSTLNITTTSVMHNFTHPITGLTAFREFMAVTWEPCPFAIGDVAGYEVELIEMHNPGICYYKHISLKRKLSRNDAGKQFSVLFHQQELDYDRKYKILINGLPKTDRNYGTYIIQKSKSCTDVNGLGSCECGLKRTNMVPPVNATVNGYSVKVMIQSMKMCFHIIKYGLKLIHIDNANKTKVLGRRSYSASSKRFSSQMQSTFFPVYSPTEGSLVLQYTVYNANGKTGYSKPVTLTIHDWEPPAPTLMAGKAKLTAKWNCAPVDYNVTIYQVQLNWYGLNPANEIYHKTVYDQGSTNCLVGDETEFNLISVRHGFYTVQVREWRDASFPQSSWSSESEIVEVQMSQSRTYANETGIVIAAGITFPITLIVVAAIIAMYCVRRGYCGKTPQSIPAPMGNMVTNNPTFRHVCKSVWIVWQGGDDDDPGKELHAENVRHLAAFLANRCGLEIILDQYEITSTPSFSSWLREKQKHAEVVLFICPHVVPMRAHDQSVAVWGNFNAVFNLYQDALLQEQTSVQFATALLPYSNPEVCEESKILLKSTTVFRLMNDIESLYFFIQNRAKSGTYGRQFVQYVDKHQYHRTPEGSRLKCGVEKMLNVIDNAQPYNSLSCSAGTSESGDSMKTEGESLNFSNEFKKRTLDVSPPGPIQDLILKEAENGFCPCPPPPVISEEDADRSVFLINNQDLLSLKPIESIPVEAVTVDSSCPLLYKMPSMSSVGLYPHMYKNVHPQWSTGSG